MNKSYSLSFPLFTILPLKFFLRVFYTFFAVFIITLSVLIIFQISQLAKDTSQLKILENELNFISEQENFFQESQFLSPLILTAAGLKEKLSMEEVERLSFIEYQPEQVAQK